MIWGVDGGSVTEKLIINNYIKIKKNVNYNYIPNNLKFKQKSNLIQLTFLLVNYHCLVYVIGLENQDSLAISPSVAANTILRISAITSGFSLTKN